MTEPRLSAGVEVTAFLRRAERLGGFGAVLHRGDSERGTLVLIITERGDHRAILERRLQSGGQYVWSQVGMAGELARNPAQYVDRTRRSDPDCWVLELDIPSAERFIAETISEG